MIQTYQYKKGMIHYDSMTKKAYWLVFCKFEFEYGEAEKYWASLKAPNYPAAGHGHR